LKAGEYREGVVLSKTNEGVLVDIGVEKPAIIREKHGDVGKRLTLRVAKVGEQVEVQAASRAEVPHYWGYTVSAEKRSFGRLLEKGKFDLIVATSKIGGKFADNAVKIAEKWAKAHTILVGFGAPTRGLHEIVRDEGANLDSLVDFVVNTIPMQGTETVRTEEALIASLAILNVQLDH
jgi:predicted SPOUT superfamily RNA methylase MTH1